MYVILEEDSEPILGVWFEETLDSSDAPPAASAAKDSNEESATERNAAVVPDNREPHGVC